MIKSGVKYDTSDLEAEEESTNNPTSAETLYEMPLAPKKIMDTTGWKVRDENKEVFGSKD